MSTRKFQLEVIRNNSKKTKKREEIKEFTIKASNHFKLLKEVLDNADLSIAYLMQYGIELEELREEKKETNQ